MADQNVETSMREFIGALFKPDFDKIVGMCAEDAVWNAPQGTFRGKSEIKRYWTWVTKTNANLKCVDSGFGIMAQGQKAFYEHMVSGTSKGMRWQVPVICAYEFKDGKVQHIRTVFDQLAVAKQAAKGWLPRMIVNSVVKKTEQGLR